MRPALDLTPNMVDALVALSGAGHQALTYEEICIVCGKQLGGKVLAGLKNRGLILEGVPTWKRSGHTDVLSRVRTWKLNVPAIPDYMWGRIMVDHARRHNYDIRSALTDDDMRRYEVAA